MSHRGVLVTGASTGIGRATALLLDQRGFTVFAGVRKTEDGAHLAAEASDRLVPIIVDVTNATQIAAAAATITDSGIALVGLVNNAGIAAAGPLEVVPIKNLREQLEVNVIGQVAVTQAMLPALRTSRGRIVNITSIAGLVASPLLGPYSASKFAFEALTDSLRGEVAPFGIRVVAVEPGQIATPIWATSGELASRMLSDVDPKLLSLYAARMAVMKSRSARAATNGLPPIEVARVVARALTVPRPRTRYTVGRDAMIGAAVMARLPDRLRDRLLSGR